MMLFLRHHIRTEWDRQMDETKYSDGVLETVETDMDQMQKAHRIWHTQT